MKMFGWMASACVAIALIGGCSKSEPAANVPGAPGAKAPPKEDPAEKALLALGDKPDVYVQSLADSIADRQPKAIWNALPAKYQADITGLKNGFAAKMDAEVWNKAFAVIGKLAQVLKTKKEMLLASPKLQEVPFAAEVLNKSGDTFAGILDGLAKSEIGTLDGLKAAHPGDFLDTTGGKLIIDGLRVAETIPGVGEQVKLEKAKVSLVKIEGDGAMLKIETPSNTTGPNEVAFRKVEGKWLPAGMVADWDATIARGKDYVADFNIPADTKTMAVQMLDYTSKTLDTMLAAKDQATFEKGLDELGAQIAGLAAPAPAPTGTAGPAGTAPAPGSAPLGGPSLGSGPGSLPTPGSLPKPSGTITSPTLPGTGVGAPPSSGPAIPPTLTPPPGAPSSGASSSTVPPAGGPALGAPR